MDRWNAPPPESFARRGIWRCGADSDGDPLRDANGIVSLRAVAIGPFEAIAVVEASLSHTRILTIRPGT